MNNEEDGYALARPRRRMAPGCPLCGAEIEPTKREAWPTHPEGGQPGNAKCPLSGRRLGWPTDDYFRTFADRDTPDVGHRITTKLEPFGDAIGVVNTLEIPTNAFGGDVGARVATLITKADYPRLRDELDRMARGLGWLD